MKIGRIVIPAGVALAPMAGVTDAVTRQLCFEKGAAWAVSEMLSAKGYVYAPNDRRHMEILARSPNEGVCGLQLFGHEPDMLIAAVEMLNSTSFDFFDFNLGCPAHKIVSNGDGCALMREPMAVEKLISALVSASDKPVTVKMRAGFDENHINAVEIAKICEDCGVSAITVHPRTRDQFYSGRSDWSVIADVKRSVEIPVVGNGDIARPDDAFRMVAETGCDGVMIARAAFGNPWIFEEILRAGSGAAYAPPTVRDRVEIAIRHLEMQCANKDERYAVPEMRKHIGRYLTGAPNSTKLRVLLNTLDTKADVENVLIEYMDSMRKV